MRSTRMRLACDFVFCFILYFDSTLHMLAGLKEGQEKMSKSDPDSAIFMEDSEVLS